MARPRMRACAEPGCPALQLEPRCPTHTREREQTRGSRQARGYDTAYDQARKHWKRKIDQGDDVDCHAPTCLMLTRRLQPHEPFDLGHDDQRRIRGPEHPLCNRSAGGKAAHA